MRDFYLLFFFFPPPIIGQIFWLKQQTHYMQQAGEGFI